MTEYKKEKLWKEVMIRYFFNHYRIPIINCEKKKFNF